MKRFEDAPPILRALLAQALAFVLVALAFRLGLPRFTGAVPLLQGLLALLFARWMGLGVPWWCFQLALPAAFAWQLSHPLPAWLWPSLLGILLLIYGGGLFTRVPLYLSRRSAWEALHRILETEGAQRVADLGAGLGDPACYLAKRAPHRQLTGIEASPLVWLVAWLRSLGKANLDLRFGSLWTLDLHPFDVVHAFLSPAPMTRLWAKACREMRPGSLLVSHTFEIPGVPWEARIPLPGRPDAALLLYRIPNTTQNQDHAPPADR